MRAGVALVFLAVTVKAAPDGLRERLLSGEWEASNRALDEIAAERPEVAVPLLIDALSLDESFLRRRAAQTLGLFGKDAAPSTHALIQALYDEDHLVAVYAATALDAIGAQEAAPYLQWMDLRPPAGYQNLRFEGRSPLEAWLGSHQVTDPSALGRLTQGLKQADPSLRASCASGIGNAGPHAKVAVPLLREALTDESFEVCGRAAEALGRLGDADEATIAALALAWKRPESFVRRNVAGALAALGEPAFPTIAAALEGKELRMRRWAALGLSACRVSTAPLLPGLRAALETEDRTLRLLALRALHGAGPDAAPALPQILALLEKPDDELVLASVQALGRIGRAAAPGTPSLLRCVDARDGMYRAQALEALGEVGAVEAIPRLVEALATGLPQAAPALAKLGDAGCAALLAAARHEKPAVRLQAVYGLSRCEEKTPEVVATLRALAKEDPDAGVRNMAAAGLANIPTHDDQGLDEILARAKERKPGMDVSDVVSALLLKAKTSTLVGLLRHENGGVRRAALAACAKADRSSWGADAETARLNMVALLDDPETREQALVVVVGMRDVSSVARMLPVVAGHKGPRRQELAKLVASLGEPVVKPATEALAMEDRRVAAAEVLGLLGPLASPAIPALAPLMWDKDRAMATSAVRALTLIGSLQHLREALLSKKSWVAGAAVAAVAEAPVKFRQDLLATAGDDVRLRQVLLGVFRHAEDIETLAAYTRDPDAGIRLAAISNLADMKAPEVGPLLLAALADTEPTVRVRALQGLLQRKLPPEQMLPALERLLENETDPETQNNAASLLLKLGKPARPLVEKLVASKEKRLRRVGVRALGSDPLVLKFLKDPDEDVRVAAVSASAGNPEALDALVAALDDGSKKVKAAAARSLVSLKEAAAPAAKALVERLAAGEAEVRQVLVAIGPLAAPALLDLPAKERDTIQKILKGIGAKAAPPLVEVLEKGDAEERRKAAWALGLLGRDGEAGVPALTKALSDTGRFVATQAAWALGEIGPGAKEAVPELEKMLKDPKKRSAAEDALKKIRG